VQHAGRLSAQVAWGTVAQAVEEEVGDLAGFVEPPVLHTHGADAAQGPQQSGAGDVSADRAGCGAGVEEAGEGVTHAGTGVVEER
jgi:hypothetical protein